MKSAAEAIISKMPDIIDKAQARLRELAEESSNLPNGENGEFSDYLDHIASELECFADQVEMLAGDASTVEDDLNDYKIEAD